MLHKNLYFVYSPVIGIPHFCLFCESFQIAITKVCDCLYDYGSKIKLISLLYVYLEKTPHSEHFAT